MAERTSVYLINKFRRLAWSNRGTLALATAAVDAAYLFRKASRGKRAAAPTKGPAAPREATDLGRLERYRSEFAAIGGNFWDGAIVTWDVLFVRQAAEGITGDLLEIGVLKGKSATLIALHARADETFVLVDPALRREAIDAVESIRSAHNVLVRDVSQNLRGHAALAGREGSFRWIHIDGEHSGPAVTNDLEIAEALIAPHGIICLDDFFTPAYPQITAAAFAFLASRRDRLQLFLIGYNKGYICRREDAQEILLFLRDDAGREYARRDFPVTLWKTANPADMNCFGVMPRVQDAVYKGPDWSPDAIPI
jgi:predicted O-methyltransferase YrrM